jgi:SagB-type dehydrogenase family enzyme
MNGVGDRFQQQTKYDPARMGVHTRDSGIVVPLYKQYPDQPKLELPAFEPLEQMSLNLALKTRRSIRRFRRQPITTDEISYLLWASTGIQRTEAGYEFRTAPSAGALYPIDTYLIANNVDTLEMGLYHYAVRAHQLEQLDKGDLRPAIAAAALGQTMCGTAAAVFVWSAVFARCKAKYGQRAYRYVYLDAGHIAENLALAAVSLDLGSCEIGAFYDDQVNVILDIDGVNESVICMAVLGHPA